MSLAHALLGLIRYHPTTGYQLKDDFDHSIKIFWNATLPQIYRTLNQMESQCWLKAEIEIQKGKPNRKVYSITEEGLEELQRWLNEPLEKIEQKYSALVKVFFANKADPEKFSGHLEEFRNYYENLLNFYETDQAEIIRKASQDSRACLESEYWKLSADFGIRMAKMIVEWCDEALKIHNNLHEESK
ncbi:PadR family transcriptional regulator [Desulfosporosinus shakirovi]|uniref:PadR family transcriptional regulator n=1 Tax=Desulfosporosinus shakirovi TaxID=2885154 RepID=UPI001E5FB5B8|nr:PadR family transcriptional regulator [Desulfosporosinus sp. SRJS8]MCB8815328.1 PadR family transcriptional regulator [Desulfosporosinus sp. SRJS8]